MAFVLAAVMLITMIPFAVSADAPQSMTLLARETTRFGQWFDDNTVGNRQEITGWPHWPGNWGNLNVNADGDVQLGGWESVLLGYVLDVDRNMTVTITYDTNRKPITFFHLVGDNQIGGPTAFTNTTTVNLQAGVNTLYFGWWHPGQNYHPVTHASLTLDWIGETGDITPVVRVVPLPFSDAFPDENFRNYVIELLGGGFTANDLFNDPNHNHAATIAAITSLDLSGKGISNLTGIGNFTGLISLDASDNFITSLSLIRNLALTNLDASNNNLTSVDLSRNVALETLDVSENNLTSIDLTANIALANVNIRQNYLVTASVVGSVVDVSAQITNETQKGWLVTFMGYAATDTTLSNLIMLREQRIPNGGNATAPNVPMEIGIYEFDQWDRAFTNVTEHIIVTVLYQIAVPDPVDSNPDLFAFEDFNYIARPIEIVIHPIPTNHPPGNTLLRRGQGWAGWDWWGPNNTRAWTLSANGSEAYEIRTENPLEFSNLLSSDNYLFGHSDRRVNMFRAFGFRYNNNAGNHIIYYPASQGSHARALGRENTEVWVSYLVRPEKLRNHSRVTLEGVPAATNSLSIGWNETNWVIANGNETVAPSNVPVVEGYTYFIVLRYQFPIGGGTIVDLFVNPSTSATPTTANATLETDRNLGFNAFSITGQGGASYDSIRVGANFAAVAPTDGPYVPHYTPTPDTDNRMRVLMLGDSITEGYSPGSMFGRDGRSWRYFFWQWLVDHGYDVMFVGSGTSDNSNLDNEWFFPNYMGQSFSNRHEGHWGWKLECNDPCMDYNPSHVCNGVTLNDRLPVWMNDPFEGYIPDMVILFAGGNGWEPWLYKQISLRNTINILRERNPDVKIFLSPMFDNGFEFWDRPNVQGGRSNPNHNMNHLWGQLVEELNNNGSSYRDITMMGTWDHTVDIPLNQNAHWTPTGRQILWPARWESEGTHPSFATTDFVHPNFIGSNLLAREFFFETHEFIDNWHVNEQGGTSNFMGTFRPERGVHYQTSMVNHGSGINSWRYWTGEDFVISVMNPELGFEIAELLFVNGEIVLGEWGTEIRRTEDTDDGRVSFRMRHTPSGGGLSEIGSEFYRIDRTPPSGEIIVNGVSVADELNGEGRLFFRDVSNLQVVIQGDDGPEGIGLGRMLWASDDAHWRSRTQPGVEYYISSYWLPSNTDWNMPLFPWTSELVTGNYGPTGAQGQTIDLARTQFNLPVTLGRHYIYARLTDNLAGRLINPNWFNPPFLSNSQVISAGIVVWTDSASQASATHLLGGAPLIVDIQMNGNTVREVTHNGNVLELGVDFGFNTNLIGFHPDFSSSLPVGEHEFVISYWPQGVNAPSLNGEPNIGTTLLTINVTDSLEGIVDVIVANDRITVELYDDMDADDVVIIALFQGNMIVEVVLVNEGDDLHDIPVENLDVADRIVVMWWGDVNGMTPLHPAFPLTRSGSSW